MDHVLSKVRHYTKGQESHSLCVVLHIMSRNVV